jgi:hypothetical protein
MERVSIRGPRSGILGILSVIVSLSSLYSIHRIIYVMLYCSRDYSHE